MSKSNDFEAWWDCQQCSTKGLGAVTHRNCPNCNAPQTGPRYAPPRGQRTAVVRTTDKPNPDWVCGYCGVLNPAGQARCQNGCNAGKGDSKDVQRAPIQPSVPRPKPIVQVQPVAPVAPVTPVAPIQSSPRPQPTPPRPQPRREEPMRRQQEQREPIPSWSPPVREVHIVERGMSNSIWSNPLTYLIPLSILAVGGLITCVVWKTDVEAEVQGHTWRREIQVEVLTAKPETEWCDSLPPGATIMTTTTDIRTYTNKKVGQNCETVKAHCDPKPPCDSKPPPCDAKTICDAAPETCHVVDNGDGTMSEKPNKCPEAPKCPEAKCYPEKRDCTDITEKVPVYANKCTYSINRWALRPTVEVASGSDLNPFWPSLKLRTCRDLIPGCEREASRSESYEVRMRDESGQSFTCRFDEIHWRTFAVGSKWMTVENFARTPDCSRMRKI